MHSTRVHTLYASDGGPQTINSFKVSMVESSSLHVLYYHPYAHFCPIPYQAPSLKFGAFPPSSDYLRRDGCFIPPISFPCNPMVPSAIVLRLQIYSSAPPPLTPPSLISRCIIDVGPDCRLSHQEVFQKETIEHLMQSCKTSALRSQIDR